MANNKNWQQIQISGDGNVVGNNNVLNSRKEEHHHHHRGGSSKGGSGGDDAMGIGFGILAAVLVICWLFVRHAEEIYFYLKLSAFVSAIPVLGVVLALFSKAPDNRQTIATVFGFVLSSVTFFLAQYGQDSLDPKLLQFSQQAQNAWVFWNGLTEHGHHVVMGGLTSAICLGAATLFTLLMGIFVLWHFLVDTDVEENFLLRILKPFRPARGGIFATLLLLSAWAFESGHIFQILKFAA
jgi:hypothetical protein